MSTVKVVIRIQLVVGGDMQKVSSGEKNKNKKKQHSAAYSVSSLQKMLGTFFTYLV